MLSANYDIWNPNYEARTMICQVEKKMLIVKLKLWNGNSGVWQMK